MGIDLQGENVYGVVNWQRKMQGRYHCAEQGASPGKLITIRNLPDQECDLPFNDANKPIKINKILVVKRASLLGFLSLLFLYPVFL